MCSTPSATEVVSNSTATTQPPSESSVLAEFLTRLNSICMPTQMPSVGELEDGVSRESTLH